MKYICRMCKKGISEKKAIRTELHWQSSFYHEKCKKQFDENSRVMSKVLLTIALIVVIRVVWFLIN